MVESALVLPLVILFFLSIFQLALLGTYRLAAEVAAQGLCRCAVVGAKEGELLAAGNALTFAMLGSPCLVLSSEEEEQSEVQVWLRTPLLIPGLSTFFGGRFLLVRAHCFMMKEPE